MTLLLTRDAFREAVFSRDGNLCVICKQPAQDAHHILERRLFSDGGYHLDNGAALCAEHHIAAETTVLSCDAIREAAGIAAVVLPPHLYSDQPYDKWGNPILPNGQRLRGELLDDPRAQRVLAPVLHLFTTRVKYPRTWHLPWSPGVTKDDRVLADLSGFDDQDVVVTIKMDGENTTMYRDFIHSRSLEHKPHPSRNWVGALHGRVGFDIPDGWRVCGENLWAKHSIHYGSLPDYFLAFSVWNETNVCLSWDETVEWAALLGLETVPVVWRGPWSKFMVSEVNDLCYAWSERTRDECEGYVVRVSARFHCREFRRVVGKYVRRDHVQTNAHWMGQQIIHNEVRK